jgi:DNA invertase Pin-like site-specific DNA recombinase
VDFANRKGYTILKSYCDRAISGKAATNRPEFMQMIEDSKQGQFEAIIVWKIDRFSRDKYDSVFYKNALKKNDVSVVSATEPIDDTAEGQLMESIFEGFSVYYLKDLSVKVSRGMTENTLKSKFNGGSLTFGYTIDADKHFQIDSLTAPIVADVFTRYADGETVKSIIETLRNSGVRTGQGTAPTHNFVMHLLHNRRYLGEYKFKETLIENAFDPIVTPELFDKCRRRMEANQLKPAHFKPLPEKYILTDKLFYGHCGEKMAGESGTSKTGKTHRYYKCVSAKRKRGCNKKAVNKAFIEDLVLTHTMKLLRDDKLIDRIADNVFELQKRVNTSLAPLQNQLKRAEKEIDNILTAIKAGIITKSTKSELEKLEAEKENLEIKITKEQIERPTLSKQQIKF